MNSVTKILILVLFVLIFCAHIQSPTNHTVVDSVSSTESNGMDLKPGSVVLKIGFDSETDRSAWSANPSARWLGEGVNRTMCLSVKVKPINITRNNLTYYKFDLTNYRGMILNFTCFAKAQDVTKPPEEYLGIKFMLHYRSVKGDFWRNQDNVFGTFGWKELSFSAPIANDASGGEIVLGLQGSSGTVLFDNIAVSIGEMPERRPTRGTGNSPVYKGHDLPRLRGVMSPDKFREDDFRTLGVEWHANLIRWQIKKDWGDSLTEQNIGRYEKWIDLKLDELDDVLKASIKYGLMVAIDLHSPPGGRDRNGNTKMFYDREYNDCFIRTWRKIAKRYAGNPAVWGYDLVNEPAQNKPAPEGMGYWETQRGAAMAIRDIDYSTAIIIEANDFDNPDSFDYLKPIDVPNLVYEVHLYRPSEFTHQGIYNSKTGIVYPGKIAGRIYNKAALNKVLKPVRDFQLEYKAHIYVGEFSAIRWAVGAAQYLSDCIDIFEEYGWDWSYHAFREWPGWSVEHANQPPDMKTHLPAKTDTDRKKVLLRWFVQNKKPVYLK